MTDPAALTVSRMESLLAQAPPEAVAQTIMAVAPGSDPMQLTLRQAAKILGAGGIARMLGMSPHQVMQAAGGPQACSVAQLIDPNPELSNGTHAAYRAYVPACRCQDRTMGSVRTMGDITSIVASTLASMAANADGSTTVQEDAPPKLSGDGWPASPPFRAGNWNFDTCEYTVAYGDTMSGLARLYLLRPDRWTEIHALNPQFKADASSTYGVPFKEGSVFKMPPEACARAKQMVAAGAPSAAPTGGAPGTIPGQSSNGLHDSAPISDSTKKTLYIVGGVVGVLTVGGIVYAAAS